MELWSFLFGLSVGWLAALLCFAALAVILIRQLNKEDQARADRHPSHDNVISLYSE